MTGHKKPDPQGAATTGGNLFKENSVLNYQNRHFRHSFKGVGKMAVESRCREGFGLPLRHDIRVRAQAGESQVFFGGIFND